MTRRPRSIPTAGLVQGVAHHAARLLRPVVRLDPARRGSGEPVRAGRPGRRPALGIGWSHRRALIEPSRAGCRIAGHEPDLVASARRAALDELDRLDHDGRARPSRLGGSRPGSVAGRPGGRSPRGPRSARRSREDDAARAPPGRAVPSARSERPPNRSIRTASSSASPEPSTGPRHVVRVDDHGSQLPRATRHGRLAAADRSQ